MQKSKMKILIYIYPKKGINFLKIAIFWENGCLLYSTLFLACS